jgi:hypothetical protein
VKTELDGIAGAYVRATNEHDAAAFAACFSEDAVVDDCGREFRGRAAIRAWCEREIVAAKVTMDVLTATESGDETAVTVRVDGSFDKTGLPDPLIFQHRIVARNEQIVLLRCRLGV